MDLTAGADWIEGFLNEAIEEEDAFMSIIETRPRGVELPSDPGGSRPGRAPNKNRDHTGRHLRLLQQYFGPDPKVDQLFIKVLQGVVDADPYFVQRRDATGKLGISSLLKVTAALRMLAYSSPADAIDENQEIAEPTVLECLKRFCKAVISSPYAHRPQGLVVAGREGGRRHGRVAVV